MKKLTLIMAVAVLAIASSCSKEKKITKSLWKPSGTWNVTASSYEFYSMGTYNTTTSSYEDSSAVASGDYNGNTFVFEKYDKSAFEGQGVYTTDDTTINFVYFVSEQLDYNTGKPNGEYQLVLENDAPVGGTTEQDFYTILSHDDTNMSLKRESSSGWSTTPNAIIHSYISITMTKQ